MPEQPKERLASIDLLRGAVMVLMCLDHTRDFFSDYSTGEVTTLVANGTTRATTFPLFFTRWVTHYCAPSFVLLAGLGAASSTNDGAQ